jgi:two-component system phosphate regulon sensor histidine kinase PhoR
VRLGIRAKLFFISLGLIALALIIGYGYLASVLDRSITKRISDEMAVRLELSARLCTQAELLPGNPAEWQAQATALSQLTRARATLLDGNGEVMGDSDVAAGVLHTLENHYDRPEILDAFSRGSGSSTRRSRTLGQRMHYVAMAFVKKGGSGRGVVRLALPLTEVDLALH